MKEKKGRTKIVFIAGVIVGFAAASFFCQDGSRDMMSRRMTSRGLVLTKVIPDGNVSMRNETAERQSDDSPLSNSTSSSQDFLNRFRHIWTNMKLSGIYPPASDAHVSVRSEPFPSDTCSSAEANISRNWTLLFEHDGQTLSRSAESVLKPDSMKTPYRGHVKVCMRWNSFAWWQEYWQKFGQCVGERHCDIPCGDIHCRYSWKPEHWDDCSAEILHHHLDSFFGNKPSKDYVRRVLTISEPTYRNLEILSEGNRDRRKEIDIIAQWHRSAHVFLAAHNNQFSPSGEEGFINDMNFGYLSCPPKRDVASKTSAERRLGVTVFNHGNCQTPGGFRENYVRELQRYIRVDAYSTCLKNRDKPPAREWRAQQELELRSNYKFILAFENEISEDWVTEKVYHGFQAGAVPVYYGAPNIQEFLPCSDCIIDVSNFASAEELAKYLIFLDQNPDKYMEYHAWRYKPMRVPPLMQMSKSYFYCGVCKAVADDIEGNLTHLEWNGVARRWVPDPTVRPRPAPKTWEKGFDGDQ